MAVKVVYIFFNIVKLLHC